MHTIVVGVDGSESSLDALRWAVDEGRRRHWAVKAILAWTQPYVGRVYGRFADPALVVGSHGQGGFSKLVLGSVSQQCTHHAPCPVVIIPTVN